MKVNEKKWIRIRIYLVAVFFLFCLSTVFFRAVQLQVFQKDWLQAMARDGYRKVLSLPPERGVILDREGHELAVSVEVGSVYADPRQIKDKVATARQLAPDLEMSANSILRLLKKDRSFVYLKRRLPTSKIEQIRSMGLEGIGFTKETKRFFPGKEIAGHLMGIVGDENQGLEGIEKRYDDFLRGEAQVLVQMKDARGRPFYESKPAEEKRDIHNLVLTIDKDIQYKAQQALEKAVNKYRSKSGQCVIMDVETGEILAMATAPAFNPNTFRDYDPDQWRNRVITDSYEPGSAMKAFLLAAALEMSTITQNTKFDCENGAFELADIIINDHEKHQVLTASDIIVLSSNIGAYKIGRELGYEKFYDYLNKFGFGQRSEVDLIGEIGGYIRPPEKANEVDRATVYYGQGMTATSLQLTTAMAAIANGGRLMRPYIVKAITDESGKTVKEFYPHLVRRVISPDTAKTVTRILEGVTSERGTAPLAAIEGYRVAGKTSTAQKVNPRTGKYSKKDFVAAFVGFAPADRPKLVILTMIDEPKGYDHYGGSVAGPVFKEIGQWALANLRVQPDLRLATSNNVTAVKKTYSVQESRPNREIISGEDRLPDFRGLTIREVLKDISSLGLDITFEGSGRAFDQDPKPGAPMKSVTLVKVTFRPPA
ncbi:MAG: transpeptidase family protein [Deltaproteobacteria bacterium]|nr:transpeptidase family protein [Deltaproteobacteria bacterium]